MRLIFWFLVAANIGLLVMRYGAGLPQMFDRPPSAIVGHSEGLSGDADKLLLLAESKRAMGEFAVEGEEENVMCPALGPFDSEALAKGFVARLSALDVKSKVSTEEISAGAGYWVFLAPEEDKSTVYRRLDDLQNRGIDCYVIPKGNLTNGISLGMFSQLGSANKRILELKQMGYEAEYQKVERTYEEVWVVLGVEEGQKIGSSAWKMLLKGKNQLKEQEKVCLDVDSRANIH